MASRPQCSHCGAALGSGANYCSQCGTPQTLLVLDPLGLEDPPLIRGPDMAPHARLTMLAGLIVVFAMLAVLWGLSRDGDPADEEPLGSETPEDGVSGTDPSTGAPTQLFVNGAHGPVLGDGIDGVLVQLINRIVRQTTIVSSMQQIDLSTGAVERIDLEHRVLADNPESGIVVNGNLVSLSGSVITITDLSDGTQRELVDVIDGLFEMHVAGRADVDSVWLVTDPGPDETSEAIEVDLDGEVKRRVEIPEPFSIEWANGDELILGSPDGSFRYDTLTGATVRMPGAVVAFEPGFVITASCEESLQCDVLLDQGSGPEVVDWLSANDVFDGSIDVSPDLSGALVHVYGEQDAVEFSYIDLHTRSRVNLGSLPIDPYGGVVWVEGSRWIIGQGQSSNMALAIDTQTGTQIDLVLPSGITDQSFLAFIPSN
jgi:hypothetical protein